MNEPTLSIALWLERRLHMSLSFHLPAARLYGIVVNDVQGLEQDLAQAARSSFIDEHRDVYALINGSSGVVARSFDAAAIVTTGWAAPMEDDLSMTHRPSRHPERRRVRAVAVVADSGVSSVIRFEDAPDDVIGQADRGVGDVVDAMEAMWFGDPAHLVNLRTTRAGCMRRP